jgi:hypothetical protein
LSRFFMGDYWGLFRLTQLLWIRSK